MDLGLSNKSVFVSAANQSLGKGAAIEFAAEGANMAVGSRNPENLPSAREDILAETGCEAEVVTIGKMDLMNWEAFRDGIESVVDMFGELDVFVTNHATYWNLGWLTAFQTR